MRRRVEINGTLGFLATFLVASCAWAASPCINCHRTEVLGYQKNAMAHSLSHAPRQPSGKIFHENSGTAIDVKSDDGGTRISLSRGGLSARYSVAYVIGSGTHASGDLISIGPYLFQAPVSYYTKRQKWDMAPGYEENREPDFTRPVTAECLACHSGGSRLVANTVNRFEPLPADQEAISCERCHGDTAAHLQHPSRQNIVNPARLPVRARDSICEQCHLSGELRVLNPGRRFTDFHPGQDLEDVFTVFVRDTSSQQNHQSIKVISHVEQLAMSLCARSSEGKLWCGTCHNPHEQPADAVAYFRTRCLTCHGDSIWKTHAKTAQNCIGCHMPKREARDGAHTVFTDHRIARIPQPDDAAASAAANLPPAQIVPWHEPARDLLMRNRALANLELGQRQDSKLMLQQGSRGAADTLKSFPGDPALLTELGLVLLQLGRPADAALLLEHAVRVEPGRAASHANLARAYQEASRTAEAISQLQEAIQLDPSFASAYRALGEIYTQQGDVGSVLKTLGRYLNFMPGNMAARKAVQNLGSPKN